MIKIINNMNIRILRKLLEVEIHNMNNIISMTKAIKYRHRFFCILYAPLSYPYKNPPLELGLIELYSKDALKVYFCYISRWEHFSYFLVKYYIVHTMYADEG